MASTDGRRGGGRVTGIVDGMKGIVEIFGGLLVIQGVGGLIVHFFWDGTFGLAWRIPALQGYEVFASIVLTVVGLLVIVAAEKFLDRA